MEGAPTRRIIEVVNKCPTQAIVWKYNKDLTEEEQAGQRMVVKEEVTPETLKETVNDPSGTEEVEEVRVKPANIRIMKDGPIVVDGKFTIIDADDSELKSTPMTSFCRCGNSKSMPYCDGTHRKIGFEE
jgi:hypothetical protein